MHACVCACILVWNGPEKRVCVWGVCVCEGACVWGGSCCSCERSGEKGGRVDGSHHKRLLVTVEVSES